MDQRPWTPRTAVRVDVDKCKHQVSLLQKALAEVREDHAASRDMLTPEGGTTSSIYSWDGGSKRSWCGSLRLEQLSQPKPSSPALCKPSPPRELPTLLYGRSHRKELADSSRLGSLSTPRSTTPYALELPMVLTTPRLSARYRVPLFLPSTSRLGSRPTSPLSPRSTLSRLTHTVSRAQYAAEPAGKHLYDLTTRGASPQQMSSLLSAHAHMDLDYRGAFRETPLMIAAAHSHLNAVRFLIESGASVNAVDKFGSTCLHYAARSGSLPIVNLLLTAGADAALINKHGKSPADAALAHGHTRIVTSFVTLFQALAKAEDAKASLDVDHPSNQAGDHLLNEDSLDVDAGNPSVNPVDEPATLTPRTPLEDYRCLSLPSPQVKE